MAGKLELGLGGHDWEYREAFYWRLDGSSIGEGLLHGSLADPDKKWQTMVLRHLLSWQKVDE